MKINSIKQPSSWPLLLLLLATACSQQGSEVKPVRKDVTETVFAPGTLEWENAYDLAALTDGYLKGFNLKENDRVNKGAVLGRIEDPVPSLQADIAAARYRSALTDAASGGPLLTQARQRMEAAANRLSLDSLQAARLERLLAANSISRLEYEQAANTLAASRIEYRLAREQYLQQQQQATSEVSQRRTERAVQQEMAARNLVRAANGGKVLALYKNEGDFVNRGTLLARIGDERSLVARVQIDELSIARVRPGQEALIRFNAQPDKNYRGVVQTVLPRFDEATQSYTCIIRFSEPPQFALANSQLQANIITGIAANVLLIPRTSLGYGSQVRVKGLEKPVRIRTGFVSNDWVQVLSGISDSTILIEPSKGKP